MGTQCICLFPLKGVILKAGDICYFEDSIVWISGLVGISCIETCQAVNMTCSGRVSSSLDNIQKLLLVAIFHQLSVILLQALVHI